MTTDRKIMVIGLDGMDPDLTKRFVEAGKMPNVKKLIKKGAQRADLHLLGAMPTITPAQWTTLATGAYPETHGITDFWNQDHEELDTMVYSLDSRMCQAEQIWNVLAEAGKKTLVFHWPGSSWPPSSDSKNLYVVDGTQPAAVNYSLANTDGEKMIIASVENEKLLYHSANKDDTGADCVIEHLETETQEELQKDKKEMQADGDGGGQFLLNRYKLKKVRNLFLNYGEGATGLDTIPYDLVESPLRDANGWASAPEGAKEFFIVASNGLTRRPCMLLKNAAGLYDTVAIYKSKKDIEPLATLKEKEFALDVLDYVHVEGNNILCNRSYKCIEIASDGTKVRLYMGTAFDIACDERWSPKSMMHEITEEVGYVPSFSQMGGKNYEFCKELLNPFWEINARWESKAINAAIRKYDLDAVFSHTHFIDHQAHQYWNFACQKPGAPDEKLYQGLIEKVYQFADEYIGSYMHLLDEGWTLFVVSDHGIQIHYEELPLMGDGMGCNIRVMEELGYTVLQKDENGNELREIDWEKTKAVQNRSSYIWVNLKGRQPHGIVEPEEKAALEEKIIDDLYNYRHPISGKRTVGIALRNKDAAVLGLSGEETGDIVFMNKEGCCREHGESMSTYTGYFGTCISPIFLAAGSGLIQDDKVKRVIRQVDLAPTIATLMDVRVPRQCEGAPVYQILSDSQ